MMIGLILSGFLLISSPLQEVSDIDELVKQAQEFVELMTKGEFSKAVENFDSVMIKAMPDKKLEQVWQTVLKQAGQFKAQKGTRTEELPKFDIVYVTCQFEKTSLDIKVVFNPEKQITGLWFVPTQKEYTSPDYVQRDSFLENDIFFGIEEWKLPGTLTLPKGTDPVPAVVLVHGSGPNDRDESIGPNKPFRDLAWGLASQNITVLRYDKRTKAHSQKLTRHQGKFTVKEETIFDVLAAVEFLRNVGRVDKRKIYVLGHSLGGMLIPRIGLRDTEIAGFIIMAGTTRPVEDVILEQVDYIISLDGNITPVEKSRLDEIKAAVEKIKGLNESDSDSSQQNLIGAPAEYWLDLRGYDPALTATQLNRPILVLQGGRDYQVTEKDFEGWKKALSSRQNVEFKLYPRLNHLFIEGQGKSSPAEYTQPGHVAKPVIEDISDWIKNQR
ncbi:MAG: alpha/beta fold hydrolase [Candidatus Aminicenantes bacterium]|jgi:dienelactone hydrolase